MSGSNLWTSQKKDSSSNSITESGFRFVPNPTLPPNHRQIVDLSGKNVAVVKRIGDKWTGSWDSNKEKFDSPHSALNHFDLSTKLQEESSSS